MSKKLLAQYKMSEHHRAHRPQRSLERMEARRPDPEWEGAT